MMVEEAAPGITVAIVTARDNEDTTYDTWRDLRNAFLRGDDTWTHGSIKLPLGTPERRNKHLCGEFGALLTACLATPAEHHVEYQLRALTLQTRPPEHVFVVSRLPEPEGFSDRWPGVQWESPMLSPRELELAPEAAAAPLGFEDGLRPRRRSLGCTDKNTTLLLCRTEHMVVLDDCCLPSPGLVEVAYHACERRSVLFLRHRQLYLPTLERATLEVGDANTDLENGHVAMGIWAAPIRYFLAINGWNTELDGQRGGLDVELKQRLDIFARMKEIEYETSPYARVYELEHTYPWGKENHHDDVTQPTGYRAPGPSLTQIREAVQTCLKREDDAEEEDDEEEVDDE
jgi:hypothetical protein